MKIRKKQWICGSAALLSLAVFSVLSAVSSHIAGLHEMQYAAERWAADGDLHYTQMSAFYSQDTAIPEDSLQYIREMVDASMRSASLDAASEGARLWYDAYSTPAGRVTVSGTKRFEVQANVTAVGGSYFTLHQQPILGGAYLQESDLMEDRVVLDETLAWQLFGSSDVAGMRVLINQRYYHVAGVIAQEKDYATAQAYGETPRMYIPFALYEQWEAQTGVTPSITCYEMVLPDPVRNYAKNAFEQAIGGGDGIVILQNTDRFALKQSLHHLTHLHDLLVVSQEIAYPYWENAARIVNFDLALLLAARFLFLVYPVIWGLVLLWKGYRFLDGWLTKKRRAYKLRYRSLIPDPEDS